MKLRTMIKNCIPDKIFLHLKYRKVLKKKLNLKDPKGFNEKLQWLKLYDRNPLYTKMVDKYEVKDYVAKLIGEQYIIPTIGVWNRFVDIDFDTLPEKFVLKCTHDSAGIVICKDKTKFDYKEAKCKLEKSLKQNYYYLSREWPYKNVVPRIIAEPYMEDSKKHVLDDYKFFCFDGKCKLMFIATERQIENSETKYDYYDETFKHLDLSNGYPNADVIPSKPEKFEEMIEVAEKLSQDIPHVRVDLYEIDGKVYFGELTFYDKGGYNKFEPKEWDYIIGKWINLQNAWNKKQNA